jgi:phage terminase large subunit-like protein
MKTDGDKVVDFIEAYCIVPEGDLRGQKVKLLDFQQRFIREIYDNPARTSRAYLSIARKNAKTATIAMILLAHLVGPKSYQNSRIISGAQTREQAAEVFNYASKMVMMSPSLSRIVRIIPSSKKLIGLPMNVEYKAISADAKGAHGGSPILAILDEVGQIKGPTDAFVEAIETSQGAYDNKALLIAISTQSETDNDLFSRWLDDAEVSKDPQIVSHVYAAPDDCDVMDREAWKAANPALGVFRSLADVETMARKAERMPSDENTFRWLFLNQRVNSDAPFISKAVWQSCGKPVVDSFDGLPVYGGLDLSETRDLTALVLIAQVDRVWHVKPTFWLPGEGLAEKAEHDRVPYDVWHRQGFLQATPGRTVDYEFVAAHLWTIFQTLDVRKIAFDAWNWKHLKPWLSKAGFSEDQLEGDYAVFEQMRQGFQTISPALKDLAAALLNERIAHGNDPVLSMCAFNATTVVDHNENIKLSKKNSHGRIDGMQALAMAKSVAGTFEAASVEESYYERLARLEAAE